VSDGASKLRNWAHRAETLAATPVSTETKAGILTTLESSAYQRMKDGVSPRGIPFKPLSPGYVRAKQRRHIGGAFWQWSGESRRRLRTFGATTPRGVKLVINTPYSAWPHDGATFTRRASSSIAGHKKLLKRAARRVAANDKRLRELYGFAGKRNGTALAREAHGEKLKMERNARRRGGAMLVNPRAAASARAKSTGSYTVTIPARPVLGISGQDARSIRRLLAKAVKDHMEGKDA